MANGRVITGFSKPYVGVYSNTAGTNTYTNGQVLARGVSVTLAPEAGDPAEFYADNVLAETAGGTFGGGTVTLTVDGLLDTAEALVYGLPAAESLSVSSGSVELYNYGDGMVVPFVGVGFIVRYMSDNVTTYVPVFLPKVRFQMHETAATTQGDTMEFQTEELTADIFRDDTASRNWKQVAAAQTTEAAAEAVLKTLLDIA